MFDNTPSHKLIAAAMDMHREIDSYAEQYGVNHYLTENVRRLCEPTFAELRARGYNS